MAKKAKAAVNPPRINPAALSIEDLAALLTRAGGREIAADRIHADLAAGAPRNADGTIHLMHYTAWLASLAD